MIWCGSEVWSLTIIELITKHCNLDRKSLYSRSSFNYCQNISITTVEGSTSSSRSQTHDLAITIYQCLQSTFEMNSDTRLAMANAFMFWWKLRWFGKVPWKVKPPIINCEVEKEATLKIAWACITTLYTNLKPNCAKLLCCHHLHHLPALVCGFTRVTCCLEARPACPASTSNKLSSAVGVLPSCGSQSSRQHTHKRNNRKWPGKNEQCSSAFLALKISNHSRYANKHGITLEICCHAPRWFCLLDTNLSLLTEQYLNC